MIKAIFFDIDCTLVSHTTKSVPDSTRQSLKELREKGVKCVIATGRHIMELEFLPVKDIEFDGYISLNSQLCFDQDKNVIYSDPIKSPEKEFLIDLFHTADYPVLLVSQDNWYLSHVNEDVENAQKNISSPVPSVEEYEGGEIYQVVVYGDRRKYEHLKDHVDYVTTSVDNDGIRNALKHFGVL